MDTTQFRSDVANIDLHQIRPSQENPRGAVVRDASFDRLADSISKVKLLVPIVVRSVPEDDRGHRFELVDGERRYWASLEVGLKSIPAHVITGDVDLSEVRKWMFHLHMTREQWGALAQCHSLDEAFPELIKGIPFDEKPIWVARLIAETAMSPQTARDRVHVLAWPGELKSRVYAFNEIAAKHDVYSYVLALEVSIIEPSRQFFHEYYNRVAPPEQRANLVRTALYEKAQRGIETGVLRSREEIRYVKSLFDVRLVTDDRQRHRAFEIFDTLVTDSTFDFGDVRIEAEASLPVLSSEPVPRTGHLTNQARTLARRLRSYEEGYSGTPSDAEEGRRESLDEALEELLQAVELVQERLRD